MLYSILAGECGLLAWLHQPRRRTASGTRLGSAFSLHCSMSSVARRALSGGRRFECLSAERAIAADTLVTLFAGDRADRAQRQVGYRRPCAPARAASNNRAGCMATHDSHDRHGRYTCEHMRVPPAVVGAHRASAALFGDGRLDTTRYTPEAEELWPKYAVAAFGTVAFEPPWARWVILSCCPACCQPLSRRAPEQQPLQTAIARVPSHCAAAHRCALGVLARGK